MPDFALAPFPALRPRRLRQADWIRRLVRETTLTPSDLVWPIVIHDGAEPRVPVASMPGVDRLDRNEAVKAARQARDLGIPLVALFPNIDGAKKDGRGTEALNADGLVPDTVKAIKDAVPEVGVMCDVALDCYTDHGHDGVLDGGRILNDESVKQLIAQALTQARAGCDVIAPSDMMDGRVGAIRAMLETEGFKDTMILSYAAKYASGFYGPYREAVGSSKALQGDKKTYQMDPGNTEEALREVAIDLAEGADMVMVKPGLPYLDIVQRVSQTFNVPTFVYQVSGEYAMMRAAMERGWLEEDRAILETLQAFKRAGASGVLSYFAPQAARLLGA
ncbi:MAG TPA: porphobilinogen synthase [Caulobacteraceae bacterium]|jgi:porphobilinogen synthase|nr:porphobilinogen synthase [Caulobacteraceae bacterium]